MNPATGETDYSDDPFVASGSAPWWTRDRVQRMLDPAVVGYLVLFVLFILAHLLPVSCG